MEEEGRRGGRRRATVKKEEERKKVEEEEDKEELQRREEWDVRETTMQTPRSVKEREEVNGGAGTPLQPVEDPRPEQVAGPGEGRDSVGEPTLEQSAEDCSAWKGLELEKLVEG